MENNKIKMLETELKSGNAFPEILWELCNLTKRNYGDVCKELNITICDLRIENEE